MLMGLWCRKLEHGCTFLVLLSLHVFYFQGYSYVFLSYFCPV